MKDGFVFLIVNAASILCVLGAFYLALVGGVGNPDAWGWFLFVGLLLHATQSPFLKKLSPAPPPSEKSD